MNQRAQELQLGGVGGMLLVAGVRCSFGPAAQTIFRQALLTAVGVFRRRQLGQVALDARSELVGVVLGPDHVQLGLTASTPSLAALLPTGARL